MMRIDLDTKKKEKKRRFNLSKLKPSKSITGIILLFLGITLLLGGIIFLVSFDPISFLQAIITAAKITGTLISGAIFIICGISFLDGNGDLCIDYLKN